MSKKTELLKNTAIIGIGKLATQFISFLLLPVYTIFLSPAEYGLADLLLTYILLLGPLATIQLEMATFRFLLDGRGNVDAQRGVFSSSLQLYVTVLSAVSLLGVVINGITGIPYFWLVLSVLVTSTLASLFLNAARGLGANLHFAIASVIAGLFTLAGTLFFVAILDWGVTGIFIASIFSNLASIAFLLISLRLDRLTSWSSIDRSLQRKLAGYSIPLVPNSIALWTINVSDRTIISIMISVAANGIYAVSGKFALALGGAFSIFLLSWTESVSLHINADDADAFISEALNSSINILASLGLVLIALLPFIFPLIIDDEFYSAILYAPILVIGVILSSVMSLYGGIYVAKRLTKQVAVTSIAAALLNILLTILAIPLWGLYGAASATVVAYLFVVFLRHQDIKKLVKIRYDIRQIALLIIAYTAILAVFYMGSVILKAVGLIIVLLFALVLNIKDIVAVYRQLPKKFMRII